MIQIADKADKRQLRKRMRQARRALGPRRQLQASRELDRRLRRHPWFRKGRRIAFYLASPHEGEIDPVFLMRRALRLGKRCYLPVMRRDGPDRLLFVRYRKGNRLRKGRFGVLQPALNPRHVVSASALGLVLMPLVGFDASGNRLGMGKGFYDRTFAFKRRQGRSRPRLMGLAHECQKVAALEPAGWDVPLQAVATPACIYYGKAEPAGALQ